MLIDDITPLLITYNEAENLRRTLAPLTWAKRIVVVDSGSTDETLSILSSCPNVEVLHRSFDSFAQQCNYGLAQIQSEWVLSLDADYELSDGMVAELRGLADDPAVAGYRARFVYRIFGRPLRSSLYPPRTVLYRVKGAQYRNEGHGHRIVLSGAIVPLRGAIYHDDRKPLTRWLVAQQVYAKKEAQFLLESTPSRLSTIDRLRRMGWPLPLLVLPYVLFLKGCVLDGRSGWYYALQRWLAEIVIATELADRRIRSRSRS